MIGLLKMKGTVLRIVISFLMLFCYSLSGFTGSYPLFKVDASGVPAKVLITLCLDASGLSCERHWVKGLDLTVSPTIPNYFYSNLGIKANSPGKQTSLSI